MYFTLFSIFPPRKFILEKFQSGDIECNFPSKGVNIELLDYKLQRFSFLQSGLYTEDAQSFEMGGGDIFLFCALKYLSQIF